MNTALIIIDIQQDYFPGGKMELEGPTEASLRAAELLSFFRERALPLVHMQHISLHPGATFFLPDTPGVEIHPSVQPLPGEVVIRKNFPNSFRSTPLLDQLTEWSVRHVVIAGMMTHMCVDATVRAAFDHGFRCSVAHDACATRALSFGNVVVPAAHVQAAFMAALNAVYAQAASTADILANRELCQP
jgi:nicotinamidase-related amidase